MKFSMMSYSMARQGCSPETIVETARRLGLDGIDWVTTYGRDPAELRRMSEAAGLKVVAHTFFLPGVKTGDPGFLADAKKSLETAVTLGAPLVMIPTPPIPGAADRSANRRVWIDALARVAPLAADAGLILSIENFPGELSPFVTADDFFEAKDRIPSLRLTFDNGNAASGEDQLESLRRCFADVVHVHLKDWEAAPGPQEGFRPMLNGYYRAALIGEGVVDSQATLRELARLGYRGYINLEYESDRYPAAEALERVLRRFEPELAGQAVS